jgi:hypothetical protein
MKNNTIDNTPTTIEELAIMIQRTMASKEDLKGMASKEDLNDMANKEDLNGMASKEDLKGFRDEVVNRLDHLDARVGRIEADIHELRDEIVYRHEFEDVLGRIKYLEKKLGIESGVS